MWRGACRGFFAFLLIIQFGFFLSPNRAWSVESRSGDISPSVRTFLLKLKNRGIKLEPEDLNEIKDLKAIRYGDVTDTLLLRFLYTIQDLDKTSAEDLNPKDIIETIISVLVDTATKQHVDKLEKLIHLLNGHIEQFEDAIEQHSKDLELVSQIRQTLRVFERYRTQLYNIKQKASIRPDDPMLNNPIVLSSKEMVPYKKPASDLKSEDVQDETIQLPELTRDRISEIKNHLNKAVVDQSFAVDSVVRILFDTYVYGAGKVKPKVRFFSGLPGNGMTLLAREFVNEIHQSKDAYKKHLLELPSAPDKESLNQIIGSSTGYIGSENVPDLVRWAVEHSGGRYILKTEEGPTGKTDFKVVENPDWKSQHQMSGEIFVREMPSEYGVIFVDLDQWSKRNIDQVLLPLIKEGRIGIKNPGDGVKSIYIPGVTVILASHDLIPVIASRDENGRRFGKALSIEDLNQRVERIEKDPSLFRDQLMQAEYIKKGVSNESALGYSESFLSEIHDGDFVPFRVLSVEGRLTVLNYELQKLVKKLSRADGPYANMELTWTKDLVETAQKYHFNAEDGAKMLLSKISEFVEGPLFELIESGKLTPDLSSQKLILDIQKNDDYTMDLLLRDAKDPEHIILSSKVRATLAEQKSKPLSDEEYLKYANLPERLGKHVFGVPYILEKIGTSVALAKDRERRRVNGEIQHKKAEVFFLLGFSSTGKTETGKALARELYEDGEAARISIDFNNVKSINDLRELILGHSLGGKVVPSRFMREYDRLNGRVIFMFEEIANAPLEVLKALYDILDEAVVTGFADGKARAMDHVMILATGNAGEEWYRSIPRDLPFDLQANAMRQVYESMVRDVDAMRVTLEKYFSAAFINRVGIGRFLFYPPLGFEAIRRLTISQLDRVLKDLRPAEGHPGWQVGFENKEDYLSFLDSMEREGYVLREQGRSIVNYAMEEVEKKIRFSLRNQLIPAGTKIWIKPRNDQSRDRINSNQEIAFDLIIDGQKERIPFTMRARLRRDDLKNTPEFVAQTSYHEAGHNLQRRAVFGDKFKATLVSRIPGVIIENDNPLVYEGVAISEQLEKLGYNKEAVVEQLSVLFAGEVAETLVTKDARHDAGKSDDIARATHLAEKAVLEWGLSEKWGSRVVKPDQRNTLSDAERKLVGEEVSALLKQGRLLAVATLSQPDNFEVLKTLGVEIIKKAELKEKDIDRFYAEYDSRIQFPQNIWQVIDEESKKQGAIKPEPLTGFAKKKNHSIEFKEGVLVPREFADINAIIADKKKRVLAKIELPKDLPIFSLNDISSPTLLTSKNMVVTCQSLFGGTL